MSASRSLVALGGFLLILKTMRYKAILFDFDGTLADTAPGILMTMRETFRRMGIPVPDDDSMRATIGMPLEDALQMLGHLDNEGRDKAATLYRELFPVYEAAFVKIFPDVKETLALLQTKGVRMAIVTSRGLRTLDMINGHNDMNQYFETAVTHDDNLSPKPAPDMVLALLGTMNLAKDDVLVVGDTTFDIEMGNRAGCDTCAVTYGNHSRERLASVHPTFFADRFSEIVALPPATR